MKIISLISLWEEAIAVDKIKRVEFLNMKP